MTIVYWLGLWFHSNYKVKYICYAGFYLCVIAWSLYIPIFKQFSFVGRIGMVNHIFRDYYNASAKDVVCSVTVESEVSENNIKQPQVSDGI